jgi:muramoyltetrapeptide carboxypeptidase
MYKKPNRLKPGDRVGIIVPSSPVKEPFRQNGLERIRQLGFEPVEVDNPLSNWYLVAKSPEETMEDLESMFQDPSIQAVWAARGGYGSNLLLPDLARLNVPDPKIVIGSSDVSYLLWYLLDHLKMVVFYGPMAYSTIAENRAETGQLLQLLSGELPERPVPGKVFREGSVRAEITGGCLSNFVSLLGTPFFPDIEGKILLLEDTGERIHRLDRMLWQCRTAGALSKIKGLILGQFPGCFPHEGEKEYFLSRLDVHLHGLDIPVIHDVPFGHAENVYTCPLGIPAILDTSGGGGLVFDEPAVV